MRKLIAAVVTILIVSAGFPSAAEARTATDPIRWTDKDSKGKVSRVHLYFYTSKTCPYCERAHKFLKRIQAKHPWLKVHVREVTGNRKNVEEYIRMTKALDEIGGDVPAFFFCGQMYTGYGDDETTGEWLLESLNECRG